MKKTANISPNWPQEGPNIGGDKHGKIGHITLMNKINDEFIEVGTR
jgi:tetrahydromethanopterin S-methyltransferase subunit A